MCTELEHRSDYTHNSYEMLLNWFMFNSYEQFCSLQFSTVHMAYCVQKFSAAVQSTHLGLHEYDRAKDS